MECLFEAIFEVGGELILNLIGEFITDAASRATPGRRRRRAGGHRPLVVVLYALIGAVAGWLSLWVFPNLIVKHPHVRMANLVLTPFIAGLVMHFVGEWMASHDRRRTGLERFASGFAFALAFGLVRVFMAKP